MAGTAVIELEGVLTKGTPPNGAPIPAGIDLYHALAGRFRLVVDSTHDDILEVEHWLQVNNLKRHVLVLHRWPEETELDDAALRLLHLSEWRSQGFDIALYVTADPKVAASMMRHGCTTLLFAHPQFSRPEYRPDHETQAMRPWDEIEAEITEQKRLREGNPTIDAEMDFTA